MQIIGEKKGNFYPIFLFCPTLYLRQFSGLLHLRHEAFTIVFENSDSTAIPEKHLIPIGIPICSTAQDEFFLLHFNRVPSCLPKLRANDNLIPL
jgi:hypothetical protein